MSENTTHPVQHPLPEGVYDNFTYPCNMCGGTISVISSTRQLHTCHATTGVLTEVAGERARQNAKWGEQNHPNGTGPEGLLLDDVSDPRHGIRRFKALRNDAIVQTDLRATDGTLTFADIFVEEVFEALAEEDPAKLRAELIQCAAVAVAWAEKIDREANAGTIPAEHDEAICSAGITMCHECYAAGADSASL